jgi:prolipoprotein diacylglyceryltransferase
MNQVLFRIWVPIQGFAGIPIFGFGLMLFLAFVGGSWLANRRARQRGIPVELVSDLTIFLFVGGIAGARVLFLWNHLPGLSLTEYAIEFFKIWKGGIILYGSLGGGFIAFLIFWWYRCRPLGINPKVLADVLAPSLALGIALGRIGCLLNGCCFGMVATPECPCVAIHFPFPSPPRASISGDGLQAAAGFTWKNDRLTAIPQVGKVDLGSPAEHVGLKAGDRILAILGKEVPTVQDAELIFMQGWPEGQNEMVLEVQGTAPNESTRVIRYVPRTIGLVPAQIYETVSMLLLLGLLLAAEDFLRPKPGQIISLFMIGYAAHRGLNELLRNDPRPVGLESNTSLFLLGAGVALWLVFGFTKNTTPQSTEVVQN